VYKINVTKLEAHGQTKLSNSTLQTDYLNQHFKIKNMVEVGKEKISLALDKVRESLTTIKNKN
jgi:hypothetical protein